MPELPHPRLTTDPARRPAAPLGAPRALACNPLGSVFGVGSELVECGKARLQRGDLDGSLESFRAAIDRSGSRDVVTEGRYWLAETLLRRGEREAVEHHLSLVVSEDRGGELGLYAAHALGWLALERGDAARALGLFEPLVRGSVPADLAPYAQHGRALALYGLMRYPEARDQWMALLNLSLPRPLAAEASYWLGDTLGRLGEARAAVARLHVFAAAGPSHLIQPGLLSLGWWSSQAGQPLEAVKVYRGLLNAYPDTREQLWVRFGLVRALVDLGDLEGASEEVSRVEALDSGGVATVPALLLVARAAAEATSAGPASATLEDLLRRDLGAATRAYVLLLGGDVSLHAGRSGETRSLFETVRAGAGPPALRWHAAVRLGQMDLEARDFAAARDIAEGLLREQLPPEYRSAALVLAGESAYRLQQYDRAAALYSRLLGEFPGHPGEAEIAFSLGWTELRRGRPASARQAWARFSADLASHPLAPTALLLEAEVAARAGDPAAAAALLERVVADFPDREQARLAALDRAVLALRAGRAEQALRDLSGLATDTAMIPYRGPVWAARGVALMLAGRPAEAAGEFRAAIGAGEEAMGHLGLGRLAFEQGQWDDAGHEFAAARAAGGGRVAAAAEYGLAATAFARGDMAEFQRLAPALLSGRPEPEVVPLLLAGLVQASARDGQWREARRYAERLLAAHPDHPVTPSAIVESGRAAAADGQWLAAREILEILAVRYPTSPVVDAVQVDLAEALLRTNAPREASRLLQSLVDRPEDPRSARALLLLGEAQEAAGDRAVALQTYARLRRDHPTAPASGAAGLGEARLLLAAGRWDEARPLLEETLARVEAEGAAEAAFQLGEGFRLNGQHQEAVEAFMTAAYVGPDTVWARRALLGAGASYAALRQAEPAAIVYRKLLAASGVEPELAEQARNGLRDLGVN